MSPFPPHPVRKLTPSLALTALLAFACSVASQVQAAPDECPPGHECLSSAQQRCVNEINKRYRKLSSAYGKEISRCIRKTSRPASPVSFEECLSKLDTRPGGHSSGAACSVASQVQAAPHPCPPEHECLSSAQQGCMNAISKWYRILSATYGKEISKCIGKASSPLSSVSLGECLSKVDTRRRVIAAQTRLLDH